MTTLQELINKPLEPEKKQDWKVRFTETYGTIGCVANRIKRFYTPIAALGAAAITAGLDYTGALDYALNSGAPGKVNHYALLGITAIATAMGANAVERSRAKKSKDDQKAAEGTGGNDVMGDWAIAGGYLVVLCGESAWHRLGHEEEPENREEFLLSWLAHLLLPLLYSGVAYLGYRLIEKMPRNRAEAIERYIKKRKLKNELLKQMAAEEEHITQLKEEANRYDEDSYQELEGL